MQLLLVGELTDELARVDPLAVRHLDGVMPYQLEVVAAIVDVDLGHAPITEHRERCAASDSIEPLACRHSVPSGQRDLDVAVVCMTRNRIAMQPDRRAIGSGIAALAGTPIEEGVSHFSRYFSHTVSLFLNVRNSGQGCGVITW